MYAIKDDIIDLRNQLSSLSIEFKNKPAQKEIIREIEKVVEVPVKEIIREVQV